MSSKEINSQVAKLARINESIGSLHFEAVKDDESSDYLVRIGIIRVVHSLSEDEAKEIAETLNKFLGGGIDELVYRNACEIKRLIDSVSDQKPIV